MKHRLAGTAKPTAVVLLAAVILISFGLVSQRFGGDDVAATPATSAADYQIAFWSTRADAQPLDYLSRTNVAAAYLTAGRDTGEFHYYEAAEPPLREALEINERYGPTLAALAEVNMARHEFPQALSNAQLALEYDPGSLAALTIIGDARLELGQYDQAATTYQRLSGASPGAESQARLARLAFLTGDPEAAITYAYQALDLAGSTPAPSYFLALVAYAVDTGDIDLARDTADTAQSLYPTSNGVLETVALVTAHQGHLQTAAELYEQVLARGDDPGAHEALGDLYTRLGDTERAHEHYDQVESSAATITTRPEVFDREIAMFLADTGRDTQRAVTLALRDLENRQDIYAYDTLAWAHYANGDFVEADRAMSQALSQDTKDPHLYYRAGAIAWANNDSQRAHFNLTRAVLINPDFDVAYAPHAREILAAITAGP